MTAPAIVLAGNLLVDDIVLPDGSTRMQQAGGALLHAALSAAAWGASVGCVSVVGTDYPTAALDALRARGVALEGVRKLPSPGARVWLLHEETGRHMVARRGRPDHDAVSPSPEDIPAAWRDAPVVHLAPMPFARQAALVHALRRDGRTLALDPHLPLRADTLDAWRPVLAAVDALFVSDDELALQGAYDNPREVLGALAHSGPRYVVHKRGARGGVLLDAHAGALWQWDALAVTAVDPTGAGDAFAAAMLAALQEGVGLAEAIAWGAAAASVAVAHDGAAGLVGCSRDALEALRDRCVVRTLG